MLKRIIAFTLILMVLSSTALAKVEKGFTMYHGSREEKRICIAIDDLKDMEMVWATVSDIAELSVGAETIK